MHGGVISQAASQGTITGIQMDAFQGTRCCFVHGKVAKGIHACRPLADQDMYRSELLLPLLPDIRLVRLLI